MARLVFLAASLLRSRGDTPGGCGRDFITRIADLVALSGHSVLAGSQASHAASTGANATAGSTGLGEDDWRSCGNLDGSFVLVQFDVPKFTTRGFSGQLTESRRVVLHRLRDAHSPQLMRGVMLCAPKSCVEVAELSRVALTYLMCLVDNCDDVKHLDDPLIPTELNLTRLIDGTSAAGMARLDGPSTEINLTRLIDATGEAAPHGGTGPAAVVLEAELSAAVPVVRVEADKEELSPERKADIAAGGCGRDFLSNAAEICSLSGMLYSDMEAVPRSEAWQRCDQLGRFALLQFDVLGWIGRCLKSQASAGSQLLRRLHSFYTSWATPEEIADTLRGIALCIPSACVIARQEDLARVVIVYFVWMGTRGSLDGAHDLGSPLWGTELNVSFPHDEDSGVLPHQHGLTASAGTAADGEQGVCLQVWRTSSSKFLEVAGALATWGHDSNMGLFYEQMEVCRDVLLGHYVAARFDLEAFVRTYDRSPLLGSAEQALLEDLHALQSANSNVAEDWQRHGVGLCLPRGCLEDLRGAHRVALEHFVVLSGIPAKLLPPLALPEVGSGHSQLTGSLTLIPRIAGVLPPSAAGRWQSWRPPAAGERPAASTKGAAANGDGREGDKGGDDDSPLKRALWGAATSPCGSGGRGPQVVAPGNGGEHCSEYEMYIGVGGRCRCLPKVVAGASSAPSVALAEWPGCNSMGTPSDWRLLRETIQATPGDPSLDPTVVSLSDALVRRHEWRAVDWVARVWQLSGTCSMDYVHINDNPLPSYSFLPINLFFVEEADPRWHTAWSAWRQFCASGYAVALYFRARALDLRGLALAAVEDLQFALKMLGPCRELDFLERRTWRVSSLDVELNLMRLLGRGQDGRPVFAHSERPRGWVHFRSFEENFPAKARIARSYVWSALRQNALYRHFYSAAAARCSAEMAEGTPALALLAWPPVFSLFLTPQIFRLWPDIQFTFFYLGPWGTHWEKCPECQEELVRHVAKEQPMLQGSIPMKIGHGDPSTPGIEVDWGNEATGNFGYSDLVLALRGTFQQSPGFRAASVLLCSGHLWFCATARVVTEKPMLIADLASPNQGMPPDMKERWYVFAGRSVLELRRPTLRTVVLRDELLRSVLPTKGCTHTLAAENKRGEVECFDGSWEMADFVPFAAMPSLYVRPRWALPETSAHRGRRGPFVVMREGSAGKFSKTMRGQHFFTMFRHLAASMELDVLFLITESMRLSFQDLSQKYRAAITFLGITNAKRTPHDLYMMGIPTFFPAKTLSAAALSRTGYYAAVTCDDGPWRQRSSRHAVPPLCSWVRTAFQFELSSFYRLPHMLLFESAADLAHRLWDATDDELQRISTSMHAFTAQRVEDDGRMWHDVVLAMRCAAQGGDDGVAHEPEMPLPAHASRSDPRCLFGLASADGEACCSVECGTCEQESCEEAAEQQQQQGWLEDCCPSRIAAASPPCSEAVAPCALSGVLPTDVAAGGCEDDPALCASDVLQFSTHLDQMVVVERA